MNIGVCSRFLVIAAALAGLPVLAQDTDKAGLGEGDAFEGKPYPGCLDASQYGHAAFMAVGATLGTFEEVVEKAKRMAAEAA